VPVRQRELFDVVLEEFSGDGGVINEVIEIAIENGMAILTRYSLPDV
jgi:hypothetical protein